MKTLKKLLLYLFIFLLLVIIFTLVKYNRTILKYADTSTQPNTVCKNRPEKVWLVSYGAGDNYVATQRALTFSGLNKCVDAFIHYGPHSIDKDYVEKYKSIFEQKRGAGYWLWKPYIILETLNQVPENDFVLYVDAGWVFIKPIDSLVENLNNANGKNMILFKVKPFIISSSITKFKFKSLQPNNTIS